MTWYRVKRGELFANVCMPQLSTDSVICLWNDHEKVGTLNVEEVKGISSPEGLQNMAMAQPGWRWLVVAGKWYGEGGLVCEILDIRPYRILNPSPVQSCLPITYLLLNRLEILHRAQQYNSRALCKISKRLDDWNECYGRTRFRQCGFNSSPLDKMAAISQTIFSDAFSWMKNFEFWLKFHWSLFPRAQLTISQHWFR